MRETITMTSQDQRRAHTVTKLVAGELSVGEAALLLGLTERSVWRLKRQLLERGVAGLVHGNRGRSSPRRLDETKGARIIELATTSYAGVNDCHLAELLAEREGLAIGRSSLQRLLRTAGRASPPAGEHRVTAAGVTACPRPASCSRPTARAMTGWAIAVRG
jgi:transposase